MAVIGRKIKLQKDGVTVAGLQQLDISINKKALESTDKNSGGYIEYHSEPGLFSLESPIAGVVKDNELRDQIMDLAKSRFAVILQGYTLVYEDGRTIVGDWVLSDVAIVAQTKEAITFTANFMLSGAYSEPYIEPMLINTIGSNGSVDGNTVTITGSGFVAYTDPVIKPMGIYLFELTSYGLVNANVGTNANSLGDSPVVRILPQADLLRTNFDTQIDVPYLHSNPRVSCVLDFDNQVFNTYDLDGFQLEVVTIDGTTNIDMFFSFNSAASGVQTGTVVFDKTKFINSYANDLEAYLNGKSWKQVGE